MDRDQILRLLGEREAAGRAEWLRLEQEAARIAGLIEAGRQEMERLAITRDVLSGLVTGPAEPAPAATDPNPDGVFTDRLLAVLAEAGRPVRCREVVAILGEDPAVARHGERVRHRLKNGMPRVFRTLLLACFHAANVLSVRPLRTSNGVL